MTLPSSGRHGQSAQAVPIVSNRDPAADVAAVGRIGAVGKILEVVCRSAGVGCAAVVRITDTRWIACAVRDEIDFGVKPADEFDLATTLCEEVRQTGRPVVIDDVATNPVHCHHPAPAQFGYRSYISVPLRLADGELFGALWAVNRVPTKLNTPQTLGMFQLFAELIGQHLDGDRMAAAERAARDAAAERQSRLQSIIASAKDYAVISVDVDGNIDNWSTGAEAVFGWTAGQAVGRPFDLVWTPEDIAGGSPGNELHVARRDGVCPDSRMHLRADGTRTFVTGACRPVLNAAGELTGFVKVCRDESERRRGEEALAEALRRNDSALLAGEVGTFTWNIGDDRLYGDTNFARLFGLSRDGTGAFPLADYLAAIHPDDRAAVSAKIDRTVAEGVPYHAEYRIVHPGGNERTVVARGKVERDAAGRPVRFPGVIVDVTERRRTEADLDAAEGRYRQLFDAIDEGFCTVRVLFEDDGRGGRTAVDYRFLEVNPAFERQTGLKDAVGRRVRDMIPEHETHWYELLGRVATGGLPARFEHDAAGLGRRFDVYATRVGDAGDDTVAVVFNDITERDAIAAALRASEAESRFVSELGDAVRSTLDADAVLAVTVARLRAQLGVDRCVYAEVDDDGDGLVIRHDSVNPDGSNRSLAGRFRLSDFGVALRDTVRGGRPVVIDDVTDAALLAGGGEAAVAAVGVGAMLNVPLVKDGRLVAILAVHEVRPRTWTADDLRLAEAVAERSWAEVERARAVRATREGEARQAFLVALGDTLRPLSDPLDVQTAVAGLLGRHLGANGVAYYEVSGENYVVTRDFSDGVGSLVGRYPVASFGEAMTSAFRAGRTVVDPDVAENAGLTADERAAFAAIQFWALVGVPLLRAGELVAGLSVYMATPRAWTEAEVSLVKEVAERTWAAVERARVEAELAFQRHQLELIFRDSPAAMALWRGENLVFERVNPEYQAQFGDRALIGKPLVEAAPELRGQGFDDLLRRVLHTGEPFVGRETLARIAPDASRPAEDRYYDFSYLQVRDADGRPWGVYDHAVDVTDRVTARHAVEQSQARLQEALAERQSLLDAERSARSEAEQAGRMKDEFLATLSHELRTPLNAIVGWTQILQSSPGNTADVDDGLAVIARNAKAQTQIIEDILDMSRIISGKLRLDVQPVDLAALVKAGADTVQTTADAKGVRLQVLLDAAAGPTTGDPGRLHQVFWNLISNAVKFTPKAGRVQVRLERVDGHIEVAVADTGEGIAPEFLPHVFDRFRQADATTTRMHGGLGLGLAIVKQIVEMHGGGVRVSSPGKGQGTKFTVVLPVARPQPQPTLHDHPMSEVPLDARRAACDQLAGVSIVVVDDEPDGVTMIARLLNECGARVRTATSAAAALALIRDEPPAVLVSDIGMPGEDGYALIRKVRALPPDRGGRVLALALTAYARAADRVRALEAGFQMHLAKPVEPAELIVTVAALAVTPGVR